MDALLSRVLGKQSGRRSIGVAWALFICIRGAGIWCRATKKIPRQKRPKSIGREERGPWRGNDGPRALSLVGQLTSPARLWMKAVKVVDQQIAPSSARYCRRPSCDWPLLPTEPHSWRTHWPGVRLCKVSAQIWQFPNFHVQCKS